MMTRPIRCFPPPLKIPGSATVEVYLVCTKIGEKCLNFEEKMLWHSYLQTVDFDWRSSKRNNWQKWRTSQSYSTLSVQNGDGNSAVDNYNHVIVTLCAPCLIEIDLLNNSS